MIALINEKKNNKINNYILITNILTSLKRVDTLS